MEFRILKYIGLCLTFVVLACEKEIEVPVPEVQPFIVVEGQIESNNLPIVILSRSAGFFEPADLGSVANSLVSDADVKMIVNGEDTIALPRVCASQLPDTLRERVASQLGLPVLASDEADFCVYTSFDANAVGEPGSRYELIIEAGDERLTATTEIPPIIELDSLWYKKDGQFDTLGFVWARLKDPAGGYNAYRWFAQRINRYQQGPNRGEVKDPFFIAPFGSAFEDAFFNGLEFDFFFNRGIIPGSNKPDDDGIEVGYFKQGDTIAVKFTTINKESHDYWRSFYTSIGNTGSPFATPTNVESNVTGGLGIWCGYGVYLDTLVAQDLE